MKLYDSRRAPNPRRVRWFMAEKGIEDIEVIDVNLFAGEHRAPEYIERAGLPNVPALTLDDGLPSPSRSASAATWRRCTRCRTCSDSTPGKSPFVEMWTRRAEMMAATPLMMSVRHGHPALAALETQIPEIGDHNRRSAERALEGVRRSGRARASGWAPIGVTIADGVLFIGIDFARMVKFAVPEERSHVTRWLAAMRAQALGFGGDLREREAAASIRRQVPT